MNYIDFTGEKTGIATVLLSNGKEMSFDIWENETLPFVWGAGYTIEDLNSLCGLYLSHDLLDMPEIYTKPNWLKSN